MRNVARQRPGPRRPRPGPRDRPGDGGARATRTLGDEDALKQAALAAQVRRRASRSSTPCSSPPATTGASDLHLSVGQPPDPPPRRRPRPRPGRAASPREQTQAMLREILTDAQWERLEKEQQLDFCHYIPTAGRYRANVFLDQQGLNARLPRDPRAAAHDRRDRPAAAPRGDRRLPPGARASSAGPSGSGKSTTLAALVNLFNETRHDHVLTMEDPVEFVHPFKNCLVNQREVGTRHRSPSPARCGPPCARTRTSS